MPKFAPVIQKMRFLIVPVFGILSVLSLTQCEPCESCGELVDDPFIRLTIIPTDSLTRLNSEISLANTESTRLTGLLADSTLISADSLLTLKSLFDSVGDYLITLTERDVLLEANEVRIDTVWASGSDNFYVNEDTTDVFFLPINPYADSTEWVIQLFGEYDTLKVFYQRREEVYDFRLELAIDSVMQLDTLHHTYDTAYAEYNDVLQSARETIIMATK
ncbi:MAG TPA: hypothetical protein DCE41_37005 [Cytophagales bacterium]|nr:hypothetical protein [Cytophagales bacterium]